MRRSAGSSPGGSSTRWVPRFLRSTGPDSGPASSAPTICGTCSFSAAAPAISCSCSASSPLFRKCGRCDEAGMSKRLRWVVLLTAATLVVVGLLGLGGLVSRSRARVRRLPDGTLLSLEAVTYGQEHHIVRGTWWQKIVNPFLT